MKSTPPSVLRGRRIMAWLFIILLTLVLIAALTSLVLLVLGRFR